jgi:S1-C subfamily serine protease
MKRALAAIVAALACASVGANEKTPAEIFAAVADSIVVVLGADASFRTLSQGSGVAIAPTVIASNCHVIRGAAYVYVRKGDREWRALISHADIERDVCTLEAQGMNLRPLRVSAGGVNVGDRVYAVGAPRGLELSLSDGLVSSLRETPHGTYIQVTAPISPGSSGGGLFDAAGRLIGLTTLTFLDSQQLNFAIPIEWVFDLPARHDATAGSTATLEHGREVLNQIERTLRTGDKFWGCKRAILIAELREEIRSYHPVDWGVVFMNAYVEFDDQRCLMSGERMQ